MRIIKLLLILVTGMIVTACSTESGDELLHEDTPLSENTFSAAYPVPETLTEIENKSEQVLRVKMLNVEEYGELSEDGTLTATITELEVQEVLSGTLSKGNKIKVSEPYHFNLGSLTIIGNYLPMEREEEYIVFLSNFDGETWMIDFMGFGKYSLDKSVSSDPLESFDTYAEIQEFGFVSGEDEIVKRYTTIKNEVLDKYLQ